MTTDREKETDALVALYAPVLQKRKRRNDVSLTEPLDCGTCSVCCDSGPSPSSVSPSIDTPETVAFHKAHDALVQTDWRDPVLRYDPHAMTLARSPDGSCVWADSDRRCSLHNTPHKPKSCRDLDCRAAYAGISLTEHATLVRKMRAVAPNRDLTNVTAAAYHARRRALENRRRG